MARKQVVKYGGTAPEQKKPEAINPRPTPDVVDDFHTNSDLDSRAQAQHHTLGSSPTQASPGDHTHDGGTSPLLLAGIQLTGSKGGNAALASVIAALVKLGATDSTTA